MSENQQKSLLLVEDDERVLLFLSKIFRREGFSVVTATDGLTGLRLVEEKCPDLVILDLELPVMDGFEFCRRMRGNRLLSSVPILVLTASERSRDVSGIFDVGADQVLKKPISPKELISQANALLRLLQRAGNNTQTSHTKNPLNGKDPSPADQLRLASSGSSRSQRGNNDEHRKMPDSAGENGAAEQNNVHLVRLKYNLHLIESAINDLEVKLNCLEEFLLDAADGSCDNSDFSEKLLEQKDSLSLDTLFPDLRDYVSQASQELNHLLMISNGCKEDPVAI